LNVNEVSAGEVFDPHELVARIKKLQPSMPMLQQSATSEEKRRSE